MAKGIKKNKSPVTNKPSPVISTRHVDHLVRLSLFVCAGGRCQFDSCNKYLLEHPITLTEGIFAQVAHIVAFKQKGPRGNAQRPENINDITNLMLLCPECHKLIDDHPEDYTRQTLEEYKSRHENRIRHVTGLGPDQKTAILIVKSIIGDQTVAFPFDQIVEAISPRYPISRQGTVIDLTQIRGEDDAFYKVVRNTIDQRLERVFGSGGEVDKAGHISLFALAPIPILILLGRRLTNKIPLDLYQRHRDSENWTWKKSGKPVEYESRLLQMGETNDSVALVLSLSGQVTLQSIAAAVNESFTIYELTLSGATPNTTFLRMRRDLENFRVAYQLALANIMKAHPSLTTIHLFPAVPSPIAVLCGRELLPKIHPTLRVYDNNKDAGGFRFILEV